MSTVRRPSAHRQYIQEVACQVGWRSDIATCCPDGLGIDGDFEITGNDILRECYVCGEYDSVRAYNPGLALC